MEDTVVEVDAVVGALQRMAELLRAQRAASFRVQAYEHAAQSVAERGERVHTLWQEAGTLPRIAPTRLNPDHEAWLPVMHVDHDGYHVTALFSNTARAHRLGRTHDWVLLFYDRDGHEGQCTVVTEHAGELRDLRVVRGREDECAQYYAAHPEAKAKAVADAPPPLAVLLEMAARAAQRTHA